MAISKNIPSATSARRVRIAIRICASRPTRTEEHVMVPGEVAVLHGDLRHAVRHLARQIEPLRVIQILAPAIYQGDHQAALSQYAEKVMSCFVTAWFTGALCAPGTVLNTKPIQTIVLDLIGAGFQHL